jgi:AAA+ ATPase superfamily predicted ATPase
VPFRWLYFLYLFFQVFILIFFKTPENSSFVGRKTEWRRLQAIHQQKSASIIVVHGRRRVGKTEFIEQFFRQADVLKFEGLEFAPPKRGVSKKAVTLQITRCVQRLGVYFEQEELFENSGSTSSS